MPHNSPSDPYFAADGEGTWTMYDYSALFSTFVQQPGLKVLPYVQPSLAVPWASSSVSLPSPFNPPEEQGPSRGPRYHTSDFLPTTTLDWRYQFQPQIPPSISELFPPVAVGTDALGVGSAAPFAGAPVTLSEDNFATQRPLIPMRRGTSVTQLFDAPSSAPSGSHGRPLSLDQSRLYSIRRSESISRLSEHSDQDATIWGEKRPAEDDDAQGQGQTRVPGNPTPSRSMLPPSVTFAPAATSNTESSVTGGVTRLTAAGAPGPSIPMVPEEITLPREFPVLASCEFGGTLTLGDALKKHLSQISGDSTSRAFPSHTCAAKLAFWLEFNLGNEFRPRRMQVTVITTRKSVIEQPSKARLAHLVAREMKKYLYECKLRHKPFPYSLEDIVLRRIDLTSRGTLRPRLYVNIRRPRSVRSTSMATC